MRCCVEIQGTNRAIHEDDFTSLQRRPLGLIFTSFRVRFLGFNRVNSYKTDKVVKMDHFPWEFYIFVTVCFDKNHSCGFFSKIDQRELLIFSLCYCISSFATF